MAWSAPLLRVTGDIVTASEFNNATYYNMRYLKGLDGGVTIEDDVTVPNLITAGNVDGVDVSAHKAGTAVAQHTAGAGDHTHQSAGAQGGKLDHGAALDGLADDDHSQYQLKSLLTTQGDIVYATAASTWARLAKGTALQMLRMNAGDTAPEWFSVGSMVAAYLTVGDVVMWADDASKNTGLLVYTKIKEIRLAGTSYAGTVRIKFTLASSVGTATATARIYRNGAAIGTVRSTSGGATEYSEDLSASGWVAGDLIQIYGLTDGVDGGTCIITNFRLCGILSLAEVNQDP